MKSDSQNIIMMAGPLHPDLFDGMTPIMIPMEGKAFSINASWVTRGEADFIVVANDKKQAEEIATILVDRESECEPDEIEFNTTEYSGNVSAKDVETSQRILEKINSFKQ